MRCSICDFDDNDLPFDLVTLTFGPCSACQDAIDETVADYNEDDEVIFGNC